MKFTLDTLFSPAKVILWPDFAVTLVACQAVVRLHSRVKYYHGAKEITFKWVIGGV